MRKHVKPIMIVCFVLLISSVFAEDMSGPRISVDEPNFNFGFAPEGAFMVHEYILRNIGDEPLEIKRVRTTCGCASAPVKKNLLQPDEATVVTLMFNSTRYFHKTSKAAIISTNDPTRPSEKVTFIADMDSIKERAIKPYPRKIDIGKGDEFQRSNKVKVKNLTNEALTLQLVDYYADILDEPQLVSAELAPGEEVEIVVEVKQTIPANDIIRASFTITAMDKSGKELTRITVPLSGGGS